MVSIQKRLQNDKENNTYVLWQECHKIKSQVKPMQTTYGLVHDGGTGPFSTPLPHIPAAKKKN